MRFAQLPGALQPTPDTAADGGDSGTMSRVTYEFVCVVLLLLLFFFR
jgi:hypothetical protein